MHELLLFDRINLAKCAKERAERLDVRCPHCKELFVREYQTARMWVKYRCTVTNARLSFIEAP